ncbi:MAG TPA: peptidoglycan bridge formation glycyltransferase FemA/FemB family protein [candidate division Zixibacteria bacterium]|nr:peptidoglycan bridge formation glycyltransferase FemA/FemB family protein [candidate division Zixibacteria bacterium]
MPPIVRRANDVDRPAWDAFVASRPEADLLQAWGWGECTALAGEPPARILVEDNGRVRGVAQALLRPAGLGRQVAYVPHGPVWEREAPDAARVFAWLIHGLRTLARKEKVLVVKMDPRAELGADFDFSHLADEHALRRAPDLQAPTTRIVDLLDGGEQLEASWHADARRLMRRAAREGTEVTIGRAPDPAEVAILHDLLTRTAERAEFRVRSLGFLERLATEFAGAGGWYLGIARVEGVPIAAMAFPRVGARAYYLYGALLRDDRYKHHYGSHAVMAAMLKSLAADGCRSVDMWGVVEPDDPDADPSWRGFSDFKRTFGGTPLRHPGLFDLVTDRFWYRLRTARERLLRR